MAKKIWTGNAKGHEGDWNYPLNWKPPGKPKTGDKVDLTLSKQPVTKGFDQSKITLASIELGPRTKLGRQLKIATREVKYPNPDIKITNKL